MIIIKYAATFVNCPSVGICAINRANNTLVRDNLYQDNTILYI